MSEKICFVIAPIGEPETETRKQSDLMLRFVIAPAVKVLGYRAIRADYISEPGMITNQVIQHIIDDPLVVADISERNPNVYYELAARHFVRKPVIHIIRQLQKGEQIPFDIAGARVISVDLRDLDSVDKTKTEIISQVEALEKDPLKSESPISISQDLHQLKKSDSPELSKLAEIITAVSSDLQSSMLKIEKKIDQSQDNEIQKILEIAKSLYLNKVDPDQQSTISGIKKDIKTLEGRLDNKDRDSEALNITLKSFNPKVQPVKKEELIKAYKYTSPGMFFNIAQNLRGERERYVYDLLGSEDEFVRIKCADKLSLLIPLFEALIEVELEDPTKNLQLHDHYAQLSYVYKDCSSKDWNKALQLIDKAIEERDYYKDIDSVFLIVYEVNRIICYVNLGKISDSDIERDFHQVWNTADGQNEIMRIHHYLSPGLREWLIQYKQEEVMKWFEKNPNKREDWLKPVSGELRKLIEK